MTDPGCYGNKIRDKMGYNSAYITDTSEILAPSREIWGSSYCMMSDKFYHGRLPLPRQRNLRQRWL